MQSTVPMHRRIRVSLIGTRLSHLTLSLVDAHTPDSEVQTVEREASGFIAVEK